MTYFKTFAVNFISFCSVSLTKKTQQAIHLSLKEEPFFPGAAMNDLDRFVKKMNDNHLLIDIALAAMISKEI